MDAEHESPLHRFVVAKRLITSIFDQLLDLVKDGSTLMAELGPDLDQALLREQRADLQIWATKLSTIREVLVRRHMKVAFFGRTSNGKSTVINALLRERVLPTGIGHTTNCFLRIQGTDREEPYLTTETSERSIHTVHQLAHALHRRSSLDSRSLVEVFWPKSRCALLREDLVLMDSPGTDVTQELDYWIDEFCLDADVFVLVGNAESTLMNTEKLFFHKVGQRISKPNIFIVHNRWDASVTEPDSVQEVRKQHLDRCVHFLVDELKVARQDQAVDRIFFVSAKEVLSSRVMPSHAAAETGRQGKSVEVEVSLTLLSSPAGGAPDESFLERLEEFGRFERTLQDFLSRSAVMTKFQHHTISAGNIVRNIRAAMDSINVAAADRKVRLLEEREERQDRRNFILAEIVLLRKNVEEKMFAMREAVSVSVATVMSDQIRSLPVVVEEFQADFSPESLAVYKMKLLRHVEDSLVTSVSHRCSTRVQKDLQNLHNHMTDSVRPLLSPDLQNVLPACTSTRRLTCQVDVASLCSNFKEDLDFRFSLGWASLASRFIGALNAHQEGGVQQVDALMNDEVMVSIVKGVVSLTSRASVAVLMVGRVVWHTVGWRLVALTLSLYGTLYLYERFTWTHRSQERALKQQFVEHATCRLKEAVHLTSSTCSQQVHQELTSSFARLCQHVSLSAAELEEDIRHLGNKIQNLESIQCRSKTLRNRATGLDTCLESFSVQYLQDD
ncbi:mitofusin-1 isoform X1 [Synchiropus splendidus]|uniref:mitofusin-1 isoform X1 n=1 Tax=Synchiropus splendidus TaxID=270530 RepID=UPI00237E38AC|nr:mitofusin-1 isoform X1 [Synchiropus splendidus]